MCRFSLRALSYLGDAAWFVMAGMVGYSVLSSVRALAVTCSPDIFTSVLEVQEVTGSTVLVDVLERVAHLEQWALHQEPTMTICMTDAAGEPLICSDLLVEAYK